MSNGRSKADFIKFLEYLGEKGLIPQNTAVGRKAAALKVFSVLSEAESNDMTSIDIDDVMRRFENLNRGKYTSGSLRSYQSRLRSSLQEFADYCDDPLSFRPRKRAKVVLIKRPRIEQNGSQDSPIPEPETVPPSSTPRHTVHVLPIALRPDLTVQIAGLPHDLTKPEAQKLANIILAHALPTAD